MTSSPETVLKCLTDLRQVFATGQKMSTENLSRQNGLYIEALADLPQSALISACKQLIREGDRFPTPGKIRSAALELTERVDAAHTLADPVKGEDLQATIRNEVILLLGGFHYEAAGHLQSPSENYKAFIQSVADMWSHFRPDGGLRTVEETRHGRANCGFALEAWARKRLGYPPLHRAYVTDKIAEVYSVMTGQAIEVLDAKHDSLSQANPALWAKVLERAKGVRI